MKIIINTDGGARGNPGPAGIGVTIVEESGAAIKELKEYIGEQTNNVAEYEALILALKETKKLFEGKLSDIEIEVRMDSELVVRQIEGRYKVKEPTLKEKFAEVKKLLENIPNITFTHVRREQNTRADELVNEAIDEHV
jgi:ribonuclease HI